MMKTVKNGFVLLLLLVPLFAVSAAHAGDFDWMHDLSLRARADLSGFRAQLATRFKIGDAQVRVVLDNVANPADAYMVLRLGEMTSRPPRYVLDRYRAEQGKGWGALAKSLGIKPGSSEFKALKQGNDLYGAEDSQGKGHKKDKHKGKGKG